MSSIFIYRDMKYIKKFESETPIIDILTGYAQTNNIEMFKKLINNGVDINLVNKNGNNSLMYSCAFGKSDIVNILINVGANLDVQNTYGKTSLMYASNKINIVKLLIDAGADWSIKDEDNKDFFLII